MTPLFRFTARCGHIAKCAPWSTALLLYSATVLAWICFNAITGELQAPPHGDMPVYLAYATNFLEGAGLRSSDCYSARPPLPIVLLLPPLHLFSGSILACRIVFLLFSALAVPLLYRVAREIKPARPRLHVLAALLWMVYPPAPFYSAQLITEPLSPPLVLTCLLFGLQGFNHNRLAPTALCGAALGLATLNRGIFLLMFVTWLLAALVARGRRAPWAALAISAVCQALILAPWVIRNYTVHGQLVPLTSNLGVVFYVCNANLDHPQTAAGLYFKDKHPPPLPKDWLPNHSPELRESKWLLHNALPRMWDRIEYLPRAVLNRALNFWALRASADLSPWDGKDVAVAVFTVPLLALFFLSFLVRSPWDDWPLWSIILHAFLFVLPFWGAARFRFPVDALILLRGVLSAPDILTHLRARFHAWRASAHSSS